MDNTLEEAKAILKKYNQEHLLNGYEKFEFIETIVKK